jgi:hypothetical protein
MLFVSANPIEILPVSNFDSSEVTTILIEKTSVQRLARRLCFVNPPGDPQLIAERSIWLLFASRKIFQRSGEMNDLDSERSNIVRI